MSSGCVNFEEAQRYIGDIENGPERQFVTLSFVRAMGHINSMTRVTAGAKRALSLKPIKPFDMLFYVQLMHDLAQDRTKVIACLNGEGVDDVFQE